MHQFRIVPEWRHVLRKNFTNWIALADFLELNEEQRKSIVYRPKFPLNLPYRLAEKIVKKNLDDPILKQFLPTVDETKSTDDFILDPVGDGCFQKTPKLLQKYQGRVLLVCTSACAMHCRYCFRQNYDYQYIDKSFDREIEIIAQDATLNEVILSGGDPLSLSDEILEDLLTQLSAIPHIKIVRFHTRFPIGIPERINDSFLNILRQCSKKIWFTVHINHPRELDPEVIDSLDQIQKLGIVILNQAVLLKGVNDDIETQKELCLTLVENGIVPYYLHQLDRVKGAMHFEADIASALAMLKELEAQLPGYAIPKYVQEIEGKPNKTNIKY